jgi:hypothetical protein
MRAERSATIGMPTRDYRAWPRQEPPRRYKDRTTLDCFRQLLQPPEPWYRSWWMRLAKCGRLAARIRHLVHATKPTPGLGLREASGDHG